MTCTPQQCKPLNEVGQWTGLPGLYLGSVEAANDIETLKELGITHVLTLGCKPTRTDPDIKNKFLDITDHPLTNILLHFDECFDFMDEALQNDGGILVHCHLGQSRSPAIIMGYMMNRLQAGLVEVWKNILKSRKCVWPNVGFKIQLQCYEKYGKGFDYALLDLQKLLAWNYRSNLHAVQDHVRGIKVMCRDQHRQIRADLEDAKAYGITDLTEAIAQSPRWLVLV